MTTHTLSTAAICCPKCKCDVVRRVPRPALVKSLFGFVPLRRYQCLSCLSTFAGPVNNGKRGIKAEFGNADTRIMIDSLLPSRTVYTNA